MRNKEEIKNKILLPYMKKAVKMVKDKKLKTKEGKLLFLIDKWLPDGNKIQVDLIFDLRIFPFPFIRADYFYCKGKGSEMGAYASINNQDLVFAEKATGKHVLIKVGRKKFVGIYKKIYSSRIKEDVLLSNGDANHVIEIPKVCYSNKAKTDLMIYKISNLEIIKTIQTNGSKIISTVSL
jgi:hypothetical protein